MSKPKCIAFPKIARFSINVTLHRQLILFVFHKQIWVPFLKELYIRIYYYCKLNYHSVVLALLYTVLCGLVDCFVNWVFLVVKLYFKGHSHFSDLPEVDDNVKVLFFLQADKVDAGGPLCERCVWQRIGPTAFLLTERIFELPETQENAVLPQPYARFYWDAACVSVWTQILPVCLFKGIMRNISTVACIT